jgi:hypothetical protein
MFSKITRDNPKINATIILILALDIGLFMKATEAIIIIIILRKRK